MPFISKFNLKKLYIDCIDEQGKSFIIYCAKLTWGILKINYSSIIYNGLKNGHEVSSFRRVSFPKVDSNFEFYNSKLKFLVKVSSLDQGIKKTLLKMDKASILWDCHHPKAKVKIEYNNECFTGFGYSETILLPIKPWHLPISQLRWGRFLSEENTITWIHWSGKHPKNLLFWNNKEINDAVYSNSYIEFLDNSVRLNFIKPEIIKEAKIGKVLRKLPGVKYFFNRKIINTLEQKLKSRSELMMNGRIIDSGWTLYEIVKWD